MQQMFYNMPRSAANFRPWRNRGEALPPGEGPEFSCCTNLNLLGTREPFRGHSYFSDLAVGTDCGLGSLGYDLALQFVMNRAVEALK